jgi:hypothetical protein
VIPFVEQILEDLMSKILEGMSKEEKEMTYSLINKMALNALYLKQVEGDRTP